MKTRGNWVIKYSNGLYYCGNITFSDQLRKAKIYHWKEEAEAQAERMRTKRYSSVVDLPYEIVAISEPKELKDTEAEWIKDYDVGMDVVYVCSHCGRPALNDYRGSSTDSKFCPNCGKYMINTTMPED